MLRKVFGGGYEGHGNLQPGQQSSPRRSQRAPQRGTPRWWQPQVPPVRLLHQDEQVRPVPLLHLAPNNDVSRPSTGCRCHRRHPGGRGCRIPAASLLPAVLSTIPIRALAGVLVHAGIKLLPLNHFALLWREHRSESAILVIPNRVGDLAHPSRHRQQRHRPDPGGTHRNATFLRLPRCRSGTDHCYRL